MISRTLVIASIALAALSGCQPSGPEEQSSTGSEPVKQEGVAAAEPAGAESAQASDNASMPELATDDVAFLERLGLIRGHLHAGNALYQEGLAEMAATHMKHPRDELYSGLVPAIEARGFEPFDAELTALKDAVDNRADADAVMSAWRDVDEAIESIERGVEATPEQELLAVAAILDVAAEEYGIGVADDGVVDNAHEYQDAWGFTQIALQRVGQVAATSDVERSATAQAAVAVSSLEDLWPELAPQIVRQADVSRIEAAAERVREVAGNLD